MKLLAELFGRLSLALMCHIGFPLIIIVTQPQPALSQSAEQSPFIEGEAWVQVYSRSDLAEAKSLTQGLLPDWPFAALFLADNGLYAVTIGKLDVPAQLRLVEEWKLEGRIPQDSLVVSGQGYSDRIDIEVDASIPVDEVTVARQNPEGGDEVKLDLGQPAAGSISINGVSFEVEGLASSTDPEEPPLLFEPGVVVKISDSVEGDYFRFTVANPASEARKVSSYLKADGGSRLCSALVDVNAESVCRINVICDDITDSGSYSITAVQAEDDPMSILGVGRFYTYECTSIGETDSIDEKDGQPEIETVEEARSVCTNYTDLDLISVDNSTGWCYYLSAEYRNMGRAERCVSGYCLTFSADYWANREVPWQTQLRFTKSPSADEDLVRQHVTVVLLRKNGSKKDQVVIDPVKTGNYGRENGWGWINGSGRTSLGWCCWGFNSLDGSSTIEVWFTRQNSGRSRVTFGTPQTQSLRNLMKLIAQ